MLSRVCLPLSLLFASFCTSCSHSYQATSVAYKDYRITKTATSNSLDSMLKPYADSVNKSMNDVIAVTTAALEKKQPEGTLGNFMADVLLSKAKEKYSRPVDAALFNFGAIRLPSIPAGKITRGKIFELSPFDNTIVLQQLDGATLQKLLDHAAAKGGWPVSGITMKISNKKATDITVQGAPFQSTKVYTIAILDYLANGGDDAIMLKGIAQVNGGYLFRDAILEYLSESTRKGAPITASIQNRVTNAE